MTEKTMINGVHFSQQSSDDMIQDGIVCIVPNWSLLKSLHSNSFATSGVSFSLVQASQFFPCVLLFRKSKNHSITSKLEKVPKVTQKSNLFGAIVAVTTMSTSASIDLSVFHNDELPSKFCRDSIFCISVKRLLSALAYYSSLNVTTDKAHQDVFMNFMAEVYALRILDDYQHLHQSHDSDLENILQSMITSQNVKSCDLAHCHCSDRKYRVHATKSSTMNVDEHDLYFYIDIMDNIHFHLFHLTDANLRISSKDTMNDDVMQNQDRNEYYDAKLDKMRRSMLQRRSQSARFNRLNNTESSKFSINSASAKNGNHGQTKTALDSIYNQLSVGPYYVDTESITDLKHFVVDEKFDTESMEIDVSSNGINGNIATSTTTNCSNALIKIFGAARSMLIVYTS